MVDFDVYRTAGARAIATEPLYRPDDGHFQFKYFPAFALAMAPFAGLNREVAQVVWYAGSIGLLVVFVRWSIDALPDRRRPRSWLVWLTILFVGKFYVRELALGQTNGLLGVSLVGALIAVQRRQALLTGVLVGLGAFVKPYALVLVPWLLVASGVSAVAVSLAVVGAGLVLPAVVYGWNGNLEQVLGWYRTVTETTAPNLLVNENVSLATMWAKWIGVGEATSALAVVSAAAVMGVAVATWTKRRAVSEPSYLEFGQLMILVPLLSPQGWDYVFLLATPAVVCLLDRLRDVNTAQRVLTVAALAMMGLTIYDVIGRTLYFWLIEKAIISVAAIGLLVGLARLRYRALA
jgi:glycosyl transferase family 87